MKIHYKNYKQLLKAKEIINECISDKTKISIVFKDKQIKWGIMKIKRKPGRTIFYLNTAFNIPFNEYDSYGLRDDIYLNMLLYQVVLHLGDAFSR